MSPSPASPEDPDRGRYVERDINARQASEEALEHPSAGEPGEYVERDAEPGDGAADEAGDAGRYVRRDLQDVEGRTADAATRGPEADDDDAGFAGGNYVRRDIDDEDAAG